MIFRLIETEPLCYLQPMGNVSQQINETIMNNFRNNIIRSRIDEVNKITVRVKNHQTLNGQLNILILETFHCMDRVKWTLPTGPPTKPVFTLCDRVRQLSLPTNLMAQFPSTLGPLPSPLDRFNQSPSPPLRVVETLSGKLNNPRMTQSLPL